MRLFPVLAAIAAIAFAAPALAQEAPPTPAVAAAQVELEAAGEAIKPTLETMRQQAADIRADATLSDADKQSRIQALVAANQGAIDTFTVALTNFVVAQAQAEGATAEEAAATAAMFPPLLRQQLTQSLVTGEDAD